MSKNRNGRINNNESERDYLDIEIGKAIMGEPVLSMRQAAAKLTNITFSGLNKIERRAMLKIGRFVRRESFERSETIENHKLQSKKVQRV